MVDNNNISHVDTRQADDAGQTMTEYALILAAVAIVAVATYILLGNAIGALLNQVIACL